MAPKLIGLAGYARTGKDTVGAYLADHHGYQRRAFADKLRELALVCDPILGEDRYGRRRYADVLTEKGYERAKSEFPEVRNFLVRLGAGVRQVLGQDVWLDALLPLPKAPHTGLMPWGSAVAEAPTVVTDVRYRNEAQRIVDLGGEVWYITRPGVKPANAEEARSFDEMLVHGPELRELRNWGTIEELHHEVDLLLAHART